jgi:hypothetical protein
MISTNMTIEFLKRLHSLPSWAEMAYAFDNHLIPVKTVIDYANERISTEEASSNDELSVAMASLDDSIAEFVHRLSNGDRGPTEHSSRLLWADILLAWAYENRTNFDDFLGVVEDIYTDFDYPKGLAPFVRYMPNEAPNLGSREANEARLVDSISDYARNILIIKVHPVFARGF